MIKIAVQASATIPQWRQVVQALGGSSATGPARALVREIRRSVRAALATRQGELETDRAELQKSADKIPDIDSELDDIASELPQWPDDA